MVFRLFRIIARCSKYDFWNLGIFGIGIGRGNVLVEQKFAEKIVEYVLKMFEKKIENVSSKNQNFRRLFHQTFSGL